MNYDTRQRHGASPFQDYFEAAFKAADMASVWWSPFLKGLGRSQLEIAGMQSKNARAVMSWGRAVATSRSPADLVVANVVLCESVIGHFGEAFPRVSGALTPPAAIELLSSQPPHRERDTLQITDRRQQEAA